MDDIDFRRHYSATPNKCTVHSTCSSFLQSFSILANHTFNTVKSRTWLAKRKKTLITIWRGKLLRTCSSRFPNRNIRRDLSGPVCSRTCSWLWSRRPRSSSCTGQGDSSPPCLPDLPDSSLDLEIDRPECRNDFLSKVKISYWFVYPQWLYISKGKHVPLKYLKKWFFSAPDLAYSSYSFPFKKVNFYLNGKWNINNLKLS